MLEPQERTLLHETLQPPAGYELDHAIGTTYSLDLTALLAVPLAFTRHQYREAESETIDPVATLDALRSNAEKMALFCQAGEIHVPNQHHELYQVLEDIVIEATPPGGSGSFHPKTWLLRYTQPEAPVRYRFLCLSRNLTYARSWDMVLTLDGVVTDRQLAYARNHPLGDFIQALPDLTVHALDAERRERIAAVQDEVRRVNFRPPEPFEEVHFHPFGIGGGSQWPFPDRSSNLVVVSPFLSRGLLDRFSPGSRQATLISRWNELEQQPEGTLDAWDELLTLSDAAEIGTEEEEETGDGPVAGDTPSSEADADRLRNLHAKLFIVDDGWDARVFTGSANATNAAFHQNVEFLVELTGKKSRCGTAVFLGQGERDTSFRDLLEPFYTEEPVEPDPLEQALEDAIQTIKQVIVSCRLSAVVERTDNDDEFRLRLESDADPPSLPHDSTLTVRPITLQERTATPVELDAERLASFDISFAGLTGFFAFTATVEWDGTSKSTSFALNLPLVGAPEDRNARLLRSIISDRHRFLQFLALLLGEVDAAFGYQIANSGWVDWGSTSGRDGTEPFPLLEQFLRVLYRNPEQLDRVHELIADLETLDNGDGVIPAGFERVFNPIWAVREAHSDD